jgi:hypothetical protein
LVDTIIADHNDDDFIVLRQKAAVRNAADEIDMTDDELNTIDPGQPTRLH